jgi:enoyl-CoA hydratase/carnithine racemase
MAGRMLSGPEAVAHGVANRVSKTHESVITEAVQLASAIADQSPDAIVVTRSGLREALETASVERASQLTQEKYGKALADGENIRIGLKAFAEKKKPQWVPSKL